MIYFDNAATTPVSREAAEAVNRMMDSVFGNPSSLHSAGLAAEREIKAAAETIADILKVRPDEIYFTSGGTESNNLAIIGAAMARRRLGTHIITSRVEHPSVENAMKALESEGFEITRLPVSQSGLLNPADAVDAVRGDTILVSLMQLNNETGAVFDIAKISGLIKEKSSRVLFHTDGVQAFCKEPLNMAHVDLYSLSAHKIHGMKGAGALFIRKGVTIKPLLYGGGQQRGIRPGTENTPGIVSLAAAAKAQMKNLRQTRERVLMIKNELVGLAEELDDVFINGFGSPYILNMSFPGVKGETLVHALEREDIYISTGAACNSKHAGNTSLQALRLGTERVNSAVRFSFSELNTLEEAVKCKEAVIKTVIMLRRNIQKSH
ncbi:MAG: cysteine desulfurase [Clostridiales bacterium]|jgi:cysteine desulfurase|nr:cysteine desulfurase [Clostridiales bacterium]